MRSPFFTALIWLGFATLANAQDGAPARDSARLKIGGATIDISFNPAPSEDLRKLVLDWIATAARAVSVYYTKFPVSQVAITVNFHDGRGVNSGRASGWEHAQIFISVGRETTAAGFADDWTMTHEMVHLAFPSVPRSNHWIEEGLATYVEPVARVRAGGLTPEIIWGDMVEGMPQGLPESGDRGLDFTHTWGRTYWGGALFCLLADVEIHRRTANAKGLKDALRGILEEGGTISSDWNLERALRIGDDATGVPVLQELYTQMRSAPHPVDLDQLWRKLGIERQGATVS